MMRSVNNGVICHFEQRLLQKPSTTAKLALPLPRFSNRTKFTLAMCHSRLGRKRIFRRALQTEKMKMIKEADKILVRHASPTLAGIKLGNLFCMESDPSLASLLKHWNNLLLPKGVAVQRLKENSERSLIYAYRPVWLNTLLQKEKEQAFLKTCGYSDFSAFEAIRHLMERFSEAREFPHEIGLFLGYPLQDVQGFIQHKGQNCLCVGCWKVYGDTAAAKKNFAMFKKCSGLFCRLFEEGYSISRLTVAA